MLYINFDGKWEYLSEEDDDLHEIWIASDSYKLLPLVPRPHNEGRGYFLPAHITADKYGHINENESHPE